MKKIYSIYNIQIIFQIVEIIFDLLRNNVIKINNIAKIKINIKKTKNMIK